MSFKELYESETYDKIEALCIALRFRSMASMCDMVEEIVNCESFHVACDA